MSVSSSSSPEVVSSLSSSEALSRRKLELRFLARISSILGFARDRERERPSEHELELVHLAEVLGVRHGDLEPLPLFPERNETVAEDEVHRDLPPELNVFAKTAQIDEGIAVFLRDLPGFAVPAAHIG